ncbi:MAG: TRAP transporter large permease [Deltaproteobacteria bacterium]|nr:TRAP transporter large permease [Deltaproteobacteria bacterium]
MSAVATLLGLAAIGVPLMVIIGAVTAVLWMSTGDVDGFEGLTRLVLPMEALITKDEFLAIPLFMASGAIMTKGGLAARLVDVMKAAVGWMPGGLGVASIAACMFFASISGSSPVTLIAVGSIMVPAMVSHNYPEKFALGIVMTAGSLGCIVPPALSMLIYAISVSGIQGNVDPSELFLAGLGPAVFIAGALCLYAMWVGRKIPDERPQFSWKALGQASWRGIWALMLPVLILGGIYGGMFTPSRAGAVAVVYSLLVTMLIYRELDWKGVVLALAEAGKLMGMLILIIGLAFGLNEYLADIQIDEVLKGLVIDWDLGPVAFMLLVNVVLIVLGALMDSISATLIFAPMLAPIAVGHYGMDPLHFGIVFVVNMEIGYLMPPVATNLFVAAATFKKSFEMVSKAVLPTLAITIASLVVFMYVPSCSKGLVNLKDGVAVWEDFPWDGKPADEVDPLTADPNALPPEGADDLGAISARAAARAREKKAAEEAEAAKKAAAAPDAGAAPDAATDPAGEYKKYDDDPLGIGGGDEPPDPAPTGPAPDAGSADAEGGETGPSGMDEYKKYDDDPLGIGGP